MGDEQDQGATPGKDAPKDGGKPDAKPDGGKGAGKDDAKPPEPPSWLPLPKEFRDFLECTRDSVKLAGAGVDTSVKGVGAGFAEYGEKDPKKKKGHFKITFKGLKDKLSLDVPDPLELDASVDKDGQFHIHVHDDPNVPKPLKKPIRDYVQGINKLLGGKGKKFGPPSFFGGKLELEKVAVTSALPEQKSSGFLSYLPTWEKVGGGVAIVALVVGGFALMGAGDSTTTETKQVGGGGQSSANEKPPEQSQNTKYGFPTGVPVSDLKCASDPTGDWNFFNGQKPGRHDRFVDIRRVCEGRIDPSRADVDQQKVLDELERQFECGAGQDSLVVCSPSNPPIPAGPLWIFSARLDGDFPLINTPGEQGRVSLFIDGGGDPSTKAVASDRSPNLALAGTNVFREIVFGHPGLQPGQDDTPGISLNAVDRRQANEFIESAVRIWLRNGFVTWEVPDAEIGPDFQGARVATLWGSETAGGDAALNNADVAPGGVDTPFGFLMPDAPTLPEPTPTPTPETVTTEETSGFPFSVPVGIGLGLAVVGGLVLDDERRRRQAHEEYEDRPDQVDQQELQDQGPRGDEYADEARDPGTIGPVDAPGVDQPVLPPAEVLPKPKPVVEHHSGAAEVDPPEFPPDLFDPPEVEPQISLLDDVGDLAENPVPPVDLLPPADVLPRPKPVVEHHSGAAEVDPPEFPPDLFDPPEVEPQISLLEDVGDLAENPEPKKLPPEDVM